MQGYEQYVCNYHQHIYDVYDWNIAVYSGDMEPKLYRENPHREMYTAAANKRNASYYKTRDCMNCQYYYICDGVEKQIQDVKLTPVVGEKITQVNFYRKGWYK
jgi:radical SAM protein with 4Fe4S-binding SPASM domain